MSQVSFARGPAKGGAPWALRGVPNSGSAVRSTGPPPTPFRRVRFCPRIVRRNVTNRCDDRFRRDRSVMKFGFLSFFQGPLSVVVRHDEPGTAVDDRTGKTFPPTRFRATRLIRFRHVSPACRGEYDFPRRLTAQSRYARAPRSPSLPFCPPRSLAAAARNRVFRYDRGTHADPVISGHRIVVSRRPSYRARTITFVHNNGYYVRFFFLQWRFPRAQRIVRVAETAAGHDELLRSDGRFACVVRNRIDRPRNTYKNCTLSKSVLKKTGNRKKKKNLI